MLLPFVDGLGMWLLFAPACAAVASGMHAGLRTATNTRRDLSIVRIGVILIGRFIKGVPWRMETMAAFVGNRGRG